jgi:hypothetical protein
MGRAYSTYDCGGKTRRKEGDLDVGGRIILKWILDRIGWYGLDSSGYG